MLPAGFQGKLGSFAVAYSGDSFQSRGPSEHKLLQPDDSIPSQQVMKLLVDYDSDGQPECEDASSDPPDDAQRRTQVLPDTDPIIQETRADLSQTRIKADKLFCNFVDAYITAARQLREAAIQRYRERLEVLPAMDCAKVCETLANDETICCDMEFGTGNGSHGGLSFTYKAESDAAFNALSHHKWKDLHETFVKDDSHSPLGNALEKRRLSQVPLIHSDDEGDETRPSENSPRSSSELSELSSDHGGSPSCGVSKAGRYRNSFSPSPEWVAEDQARSLGASKDRGPSFLTKQVGHDVSKSQLPGRPPNGPWSEEEEAVMRNTMTMQLQARGHVAYSRQATMNLEDALPRRTTAAIKNKWLSLRTKATWDERTGTSGKTRVGDDKAKVLIKGPEVETHDENDSGSLMEYVDNGPDSSPRLLKFKRPGQSEAAGASESRRKIRPAKEPHAQLWSPQEIEIVTTLTKGLNKVEEIDFKYIAAQLPDPFRRSEKACKSFWVRRVEPSRLSKGKDPKSGNEAPAKRPDSISKLIPPGSSKNAKKRGPGTVISVARRHKHARGSSNEGEERAAAHRKKLGGAHTQSFLRRRDHDDGSEAEDSDVYMYDLE